MDMYIALPSLGSGSSIGDIRPAIYYLVSLFLSFGLVNIYFLRRMALWPLHMFLSLGFSVMIFFYITIIFIF